MKKQLNVYLYHHNIFLFETLDLLFLIEKIDMPYFPYPDHAPHF